VGALFQRLVHHVLVGQELEVGREAGPPCGKGFLHHGKGSAKLLDERNQ
jgi:hypothetical protein